MKKISPIVLAALLCSQVFAQNLNPEVEVTNDYEARLSGIRKSVLPMAVPDSLKNFRTSVDYSVFETTYKGAYDFRPYAINVTPEAGVYDGRRFYLRAGAGYSFHPVLQAVFSPDSKGRLYNTSHLDFSGYGGVYHSAGAAGDYSGHDYGIGAGTSLSWRMPRLQAGVEALYHGIFTKDCDLSSVFNDFGVTGKLGSTDPSFRIPFELSVTLAHAQDDAGAGLGTISENSYLLDGSVYAFRRGNFSAGASVHTQGSFLNAALPGSLSRFSLLLTHLTPGVVFDNGPVRVSAGLRIGIGDKFAVYPDITARLGVGAGLLEIYGGLTGGPEAYDYSAIKGMNHWFNYGYLQEFKTGEEKIGARLGVRGSISSRVQYDLSGGYVDHGNALLDGLSSDYPGGVQCAAYYADFSEFFGKLSLAWVSDSFNLGAGLLYRKTDLEASDTYLGVPAFSMEVTAVYNWNHRLYAGLRAKAQTPRSSLVWQDKGFVDLGLYSEYGITQSLSLWVQAGNLLNQRITLYPTHIPGGINFTAGISLKLG